MTKSLVPQPLVLLDLDGTLMDSAPGIITSAVKAFDAIGMDIPDDGALRALIGPAITTSFPEYGVPADRMDEAIAIFRDEFRTRGMWNNSVFPGIPEQLAALREAGCLLVVATGKPSISAEPICERFGLTELVDGIFGTPPDGRETKAQVIGKALAALGRGAQDGPTLMVGDRLHDVEGAREHGIGCLGVSWVTGQPVSWRRLGPSPS